MLRIAEPRRAMRRILLAAGVCLAGPPAVANPGDAVTSSVPAIEKGVAAVEDGDYRQAVRHLKKHLRDNADDADALNLMGYSLRKLGKLEKSEQYYLRALKIDPDHLGANEYLGELYLETGRPELARERLAVLEKACPGACEEREELNEAIAEYADKKGP